MRSDFCVFVLSHGRPDRQYTMSLLRRRGYTGRVYLVIDDEDAQRQLARELLTRLGYTITTVSSGEAALEEMAKRLAAAGAGVEVEVTSPGPYRGERKGGLGIELIRRRLDLAYSGGGAELSMACHARVVGKNLVPFAPEFD